MANSSTTHPFLDPRAVQLTVIANLPAEYIAPIHQGGVSNSRPSGACDLLETSRTLNSVRNQRQIVDYALRRRALLARFRSGRVPLAELCDASPYLRQAARFHGEQTEHSCPVCRKSQVVLVAWVYGDGLGQASGSARKPAELERMANLFAEFTVYVVEVCHACGWNHLAMSYVLGTGEPGTRAPAPRTRPRKSAAP
jgi:hypothetical protein